MKKDTVLKWFAVWVLFVVLLIAAMICGGASLIVKFL
jgi:hypothetical protein